MSRSNPRVLSTLERAGGFASAQEVYRLMQREGESIGLTTVYRSLQSLVNDKIVDVLRREDGEAIYRLCGEAHHLKLCPHRESAEARAQVLVHMHSAKLENIGVSTLE